MSSVITLLAVSAVTVVVGSKVSFPGRAEKGSLVCISEAEMLAVPVAMSDDVSGGCRGPACFTYDALSGLLNQMPVTSAWASLA